MEVRIIPSALTHELRHQVLWPHKLSVSDCFIDIDDETSAFHLGVFDQEKIVSVGSFFSQTSSKVDATNPYRLRAMATSPYYHGRGCGKRLISFAETILKDKKADVLWCDAREVAVGFYSAIGFSMIEEPYDIPIIGKHFFMWKNL